MSCFSRNRYVYPALLAVVSLQGVLPLRDQWRAGCDALGAGESQRALALFREFDHWYAAEPAVAEPDFQESRIRLWALAALEAGSLEEAAGLLERWLSENPDQQRFRAFLRFQLAELHRALGRPDRVEIHRQQFLDDHPELPECILIHWSRADEALAHKDTKAARSHMAAVLHHPGLPPSGRSLAGAAMAAIELAEGNQMAALEHLAAPDADKADPVLEFWRGLMAPSLVQQLLAAGLPEPARTAAGWFDKPDNLRDGLRAFRKSLPAGGTGSGIRQSIWNGRWSAQLHQLEAALQQVSENLDDIDPLYALRLRALLQTKASRDAAILGRALVESPHLIGPVLRAEAYKGVIEACLQLSEWSKADAYARDFLDTYPDDPALPDILFMNARTAAARKDWPAALDQVSLLIGRYTSHPAVLSWKILQATWLLAAGHPAEALQVLQACTDGTPPAWQPFLQFQMGRCREALGELDAAGHLYRSVAGLDEAPSSLRESAHTALLKLHLRRLDADAFTEDLAAYRTSWPDGMNRLLVENLAGSFHRQTGNIERAVDTFKRVAEESHPAAAFARSQLSAMYRESDDMAALRLHALDWVSAALSDGSSMPPEPFLDLQLYRRSTNRQALPDATVGLLLDAIEAGNPRLPANAILDLLRLDWETIRIAASADEPGIREWVESQANAFHAEGNWPAYSVYQLYAARLYEEAGRRDSADARRIQVLQSVEPAVLGESALFTVAGTAQAYDFPEQRELLERFLIRFPHSRERPGALFLLADVLRSDGDVHRANSLLQEIRSAWPDSGIHKDACLRLAVWQIEDGAHEAALDVLATLLEAPRLPPEMTARALLLRARADFHTARAERAALDVFRILALYPDFHDITDSAVGLLLEHLRSLDDPQQRAALAERLLATAPADVLARFQFTDA